MHSSAVMHTNKTIPYFTVNYLNTSRNVLFRTPPDALLNTVSIVA